MACELAHRATDIKGQSVKRKSGPKPVKVDDNR